MGWNNASVLRREPILLNEKLPIVRDASVLLAMALSKLKIEPYPKNSVEAYKKEKLKKVAREFPEKFSLSPFFRRMGDMLSVLVSVLAIANLAGFAGLDAWSGVFGLYFAYFGLFCVYRVSAACESEESALSWERISAYRYEGRIPESVRNTLLRIREKLPATQFEVDYLVRMKDKKVFDPLLVAKYGECEYYIEVWDEDYAGFSE